MQDLTVERLKEVLRYDPETGLFWWKIRTGPRCNMNKPAGYKNNLGYINIQLFGVNHRAHRLAWLYIYGKWPEYDVDHKNAIVYDNRMVNLRDVPHEINMENQRNAHRNNKTGLLGVSFDKKANKFRAQITIKGKKKCLGWFSNQEEAHKCYIENKRKYHNGCTI